MTSTPRERLLRDFVEGLPGNLVSEETKAALQICIDVDLAAPSLEAREPPSVKAGDEVHAWVGTKDGWGKVLSRVDGGIYVEFPDAKYPDTLAVPTGQYFVPWKAVIAIKGASALRGEG